MNETLSCNLTIYDLNDKTPEFSYPEEGEDIWINEVKHFFNIKNLEFFILFPIFSNN